MTTSEDEDERPLARYSVGQLLTMHQSIKVLERDAAPPTP